VIFKIDGRPQFAPVESSRQSGEKDGSGGKTEDRGQTAEGRKPPQGAADKRRRRKRR
jgi:hypothetical protein